MAPQTMMPRYHVVRYSIIAMKMDFLPALTLDSYMAATKVQTRKRDSSENTALCHFIVHVGLVRYCCFVSGSMVDQWLHHKYKPLMARRWIISMVDKQAFRMFSTCYN
ncbi:hypothetical protein TNCV_1240121 [Trichonephila clavipes]|uniref:Uncharacterized protein n=1 Tax=Trichonephila clavipes TaxID=2585209 RepID=A0A8X6WFP4_TRICX|nr:hypothetical protein TNCV_1240121 [Trichonephila clavipes]